MKSISFFDCKKAVSQPIRFAASERHCTRYNFYDNRQNEIDFIFS